MIAAAEGPEILVVAISGRALAHSAAKTGARLRVLDAFADRDTQAVAQAACVSASDAIALDPARLIAALSELPAGDRAIVPGSGFERAPQLLDRLRAHGRVYANDAGIVAALKEPETAAELLRTLGWDVPTTQLTVPDDPRGWLRKQTGGAGGWHVRRAEGARPHPGTYYQREVPGRAMSVTFLGDAERAHILGFNTQTLRAIGAAPFCYAGAATCTLDASLEQELQARLDRLVRATGLCGLNGLDFILDDAALHAIEVNPRPTATFELYEEDFPEGLVHWHLRSFGGALPGLAPRLRTPAASCRAYEVVFARTALRVPQDAHFPEWCADLPGPGSVIQPGAPVLSVFAAGESEVLARRNLSARLQEVERLMQSWCAGAVSAA
jgi:predicted ATP-grasp superfamily ATP-dependent carboligase